MQNKSKTNWLPLMLLALVVLQFFMIAAANFTKAYGFLDYDSALAIRHAIELW